MAKRIVYEVTGCRKGRVWLLATCYAEGTAYEIMRALAASYDTTSFHAMPGKVPELATIGQEDK